MRDKALHYSALSKEEFLFIGSCQTLLQGTSALSRLHSSECDGPCIFSHQWLVSTGKPILNPLPPNCSSLSYQYDLARLYSNQKYPGEIVKTMLCKSRLWYQGLQTNGCN